MSVAGAGTLASAELRPRAGRRNAKRYTATGDFLSMLRRMVAAAGARVGEADVPDLVALYEIQEDIDAAVQRGIDGLREDGYSWQSIGEGFGITRQAALMRWGPTRARYRRAPSSSAAS